MRTDSKTSCIKCLSSLNVTFLAHGLDAGIISDFIIESLEEKKQHYEVIKSSLNFDERVKHQTTLFQIQHLLSLLQRVKAHS